MLPPRATQYHKNPGQTVDFHRFWGDEIIAAYCEQRDAIREHSDRPVTTNLMLPYCLRLNLWAFARLLDSVSSDQYPSEPGLDSAAHVAFYADRSRSLADGRPWLLMEQGTSSVYDGGQMIGKEPGEILRHSLGHIARGSEGALFFQWRQSRAGAETWHSAMLPHAGPDSRVFREVTQTGEAVAALGELAGSTVTASVAVLDDPDAMWALEADGLPSARLDHHAPLAEAHRALWDAGVTVDFAHPEHELSRYRLVIAPSLFLLSDKGAENLRRYVAGGGRLLVQHAAGFVDDRMHARLGGYPAEPLREALGIRVEEHRPLRTDQRITLSDGSDGTVWSESLRAVGAETLAAYTHGMLADRPALTQHRFGTGQSWYPS
ncbi:beta-galactosidase [Streptomyces sp. NPDC056948]|uniref:beta-galactosidase n=1 Tax=Streptomyces sp. NPDC056948 TaxID=3345975 RepID=UPI0036435B3C